MCSKLFILRIIQQTLLIHSYTVIDKLVYLLCNYSISSVIHF